MRQMQMLQSRERQILPSGRTAKSLRARSTKSVAEIRKRIEILASPYAEIDNSVEGAVAVLMTAFDEFERCIKQTQEWLEQAAD